jgi:hypothetical protein
MAPTKKTSVTKQMFVEPETEMESVEQTAIHKEDSAVSLPASGFNQVDLPSDGVFGYPSHVEYRDILVKDEEVLASATVDTYSKTLNAVLKSVMNDAPFYEQMTIHDRDYMLVWVWANNYTATKDVEITCSHCSHKQVKRVDLTKLPQTNVSKTIKVPFEIPLRSGNKIMVRLNTVADEIFAEEYIRKNKSAKFEHVMMMRSIDVGVAIPFEAKMKWISENVTGKEMGMVRKFHSHFAFGVNPRIEHVCDECSGVTHGDVPFQTEDILFPTVSSDFEKLL